MALQHRAGPLPNSSHVTLTRELVPLLGDRGRMPVPEADVAAFKVDKELAGTWTMLSIGCAIYARV